MKIKTLLAAISALTLTACVSAVAWKSVIVGADLTSPALPVVTDAASNTYQLFPLGTQLYLRKLDPKGVELWQVGVDETLANNIAAPVLRNTPNGIAVAYHDTAIKQAFLRQFDTNGLTLWSSDFGTHTSETVSDIAIGADGGISVALRLSSKQNAVIQFDNTGLSSPEKIFQRTGLTACLAGCPIAIAVDASGHMLVNLSEIGTVYSYFLDQNGAQLWSKSKTFNVGAGAPRSPIAITTDGFVSTNTALTWKYDLSGNETWSYTFGSVSKPEIDASGNVYALETGYLSTALTPVTQKLHKIASDGALLWEATFTDQINAKQIEWREDLQRLVALTYYEKPSFVELTLSGSNEYLYRWYAFTPDGVQKANYKGSSTLYKNVRCTSLANCAEVAQTLEPDAYGEKWAGFAITPDKKVVISGMIKNSEHFVKAYKLP